jgi:alpha-tubulin suppressor-like RCC1 family protein
VVGGELHTCALLADGSVECWGNNQGGQLGDGTLMDSPLPVVVKF